MVDVSGSMDRENRLGLVKRSLHLLLDELAEDTPKVRDAYRYAMQCEVDFFSAPLDGRR